MATSSRKTPPRPARRTKAEVEKEFAAVREQVEDARREATAKSEEVAKWREEETRHAVEGISVETVVQHLSTLSVEVSKALARLSEQLVEEVGRLEAVREVVELETKNLGRLHQIDVAATAIDQLTEDYARRKEELEQEISAQRGAWEQETLKAERERKEAEELLKKQRQREIEEYEYKKSIERKKAQDKYDEEMRLLEKKNQEKQEALTKGWQQREAALKESEDELARLRQESKQAPERLAKELERVSAEATRQAEARFEQQLLVLKKDAEAEKRLADLRIRTLEDTVSHQVAQIDSLGKQLDEAKKQVQDIAIKAIEGASGAKTLSHVNQIAMEQAKHRSPQG